MNILSGANQAPNFPCCILCVYVCLFVVLVFFKIHIDWEYRTTTNLKFNVVLQCYMLKQCLIRMYVINNKDILNSILPIQISHKCVQIPMLWIQLFFAVSTSILLCVGVRFCVCLNSIWYNTIIDYSPTRIWFNSWSDFIPYFYSLTKWMKFYVR